MRETLFRGKRLDNEEWIEGSAVWFDKDKCFIVPQYSGASTLSYAQIFALTAVMVDPSTVGQYAELTDKNGVKIFDGDCIREFRWRTIGVIRYGEHIIPISDGLFSHQIGFYVEWVSGKYKDYLQKGLCYWLRRAESIGNIHDNPELQKGGDTA